MVLVKVFSVLILLLLFSSTVKAQSFGFGCLGLVGGFGGYSYQVYKPLGLNSEVTKFNLSNADSVSSPMGLFGKSAGYRVGINFFRANFEGFILTTKGYYQSLSEKHDGTSFNSDGMVNTSYEVKIKSWGLGIDLGTSITKSFSWKVIDAAIVFNSADFTNTQNLPGAITNVLSYSTEKSVFGYSIGTGFIYSLIDHYISIEGLVAFSVIPIKTVVLQVDENNDFRSDTAPAEINNFIESGGLNTVLQLNISLPL